MDFRNKFGLIVIVYYIVLLSTMYVDKKYWTENNKAHEVTTKINKSKVPNITRSKEKKVEKVYTKKM